MKRLFRKAWPWLSILAGLLAGLLLPPAEPAAEWWPAAEWARHALTGLGVGFGVLLIGGVLGLVTGTIGFSGLQFGSPTQNADDLDDIRRRLAAVVEVQQELTRTATEALTLSREAMNALLSKGSAAPSSDGRKKAKASKSINGERRA